MITEGLFVVDVTFSVVVKLLAATAIHVAACKIVQLSHQMVVVSHHVAMPVDEYKYKSSVKVEMTTPPLKGPK